MPEQLTEGMPPEAGRQWRNLRIVSVALPEIVPLLVLVGWVVVHDGGVPVEGVGTSRMVLAVFGVVALVSVLVMPSVITRSFLGMPASPQSGASPESLAASRALAVLLARYAVCEAPALLGFALYVTGASLLVFAAFILLTLAGYAVHFPRRDQFEDTYRRARDLAAPEVPAPL